MRRSVYFGPSFVSAPRWARPLLMGAALAGAVLCALVFFGEDGAPARAAPKSDVKAPLVEILSSTATAYPRSLRLRGVTEAARKVVISAQTAGLVVSEPRRKGERIEKGATLCEVETGDRAAKLAEAKARLLEAEAVAKASTELGKKGFSAETTRARDQAALEAARAVVAAMELDVARTRMVAPFDGWLETDTAELGALLSVGAPCATLLSLNPIRLVGFAAEDDVGALEIGQAVDGVLKDGRRVEATINFVARAADPETRTFRVEAAASNPETAESGVLRDGATVLLEIKLGERPAHKTPRTALMINDEGRVGVMLAENGVARFQPVEILSDNADGLWLSGPPEEAQIVVTGQYFISDGAPVRTAPYQPAAPQATAEKDVRQ